MKRFLVAVFFTMLSASPMLSQTPSSEPKPAELLVPEETVEGFWSVMGYFGGKLTSELGNRLNLSKQYEPPGVPTKVKLKLGSLEFVRTDNRRSANR